MGVTQISWSGVGSLIDPPAEEVEQPLLHSNAMPSCASANRDHQQSWATPEVDFLREMGNVGSHDASRHEQEGFPPCCDRWTNT